MAYDDLVAQVARWEAAGYIDRATATKLLEFEQSRGPDAAGAHQATVAGATVGRTGSAAGFFGPPVAVGELLGYVGGFFLLLGWHAVLESALGGDWTIEQRVRAIQLGFPAILLFGIAVVLGQTDPRRSRAAGVSFLLGAGYAGLAAAAAVALVFGPLDSPPRDLVIAASALTVAAVARRVHPSVLTQVALVGSFTTLVHTSLVWAESVAFPSVDPIEEPVDPVLGAVRVGVTLAWWLVAAFAIGVASEREAASAIASSEPTERAARDRRAAVSRFACGLTAVIGTTIAVFQTMGFERIVPPILGDVAILLTSGVLMLASIRSGYGAFLYPAAFGVIVALTDANARTMGASGIGGALIIEGLILVAAGFAAARLSRWIADRRTNLPLDELSARSAGDGAPA